VGQLAHLSERIRALSVQVVTAVALARLRKAGCGAGALRERNWALALATFAILCRALTIPETAIASVVSVPATPNQDCDIEQPTAATDLQKLFRQADFFAEGLESRIAAQQCKLRKTESSSHANWP
jgi:hypothetical protein